MLPSATASIVRIAAALVPSRHRENWRREWLAELSYAWQRAGRRPSIADRWRLTGRASSALVHAGWLRAQEMTLDHILQDLRLAFRLLRRQPSASAIAIFTLALGIGANTAVFSLVNAVLLRPLPVDHLDQLFVVREELPDLDLNQAELAPAEVVDLAGRTDVFDAVTGFRVSDRTLTGFGEPKRVGSVATLGDFAGVFGIRPHLGHFYPPEQSTAGPVQVAVVSYGLWQELSGGSRSFVGHTIDLDDIRHEVVGVMPPDVRYPADVQVWTPFAFTDRWKTNRGSLFMKTVVRARAGFGREAVDARLASEAARWNEQYHRGGAGKVLRGTGFIEYLAGPLHLILLVLMGAVAFVLLIAAANVASLQLVRLIGRSREVAVRSAIGAGRGRIIRQFFIESAVLSMLGGALGLWMGSLALDLLTRWGPAEGMPLSDVTLDGTVLAFTAAVTVVTAVAFGILPALQGSRTSLQRVLHDSGRSASAVGSHRLLEVSVVAQVSLALVLLLGTGLMVRTLSRMIASDVGFDPANLVVAEVSITQAKYNSSSLAVGFFDTLLERVRAAPGVESAALAFGLPFLHANDSSPFEIIGRPGREDDPERHAEAAMVSPGYFRTMGIRLLRGRDFSGTEGSGSPIVAVIDQTFAEQFFPDENPVGRRIRGYFGDEATIIGVAARVDHDEIGDAPKALTYYSYRQQPWVRTRSVIVRSTLPVGSVTSALRAIVSNMDADVPVYGVTMMEDAIAESLGPRRLAMLALSVFSGLSLLLAAVGVYGVMHYTTRQRTREIGIRMALGAQPRSVVRLIVWQGFALTAMGIVIGTVVALSVTRLMTAMLFEVSPHDPATFAGGAAVLSAVTLVAALAPAVRAARVDPTEALRGD